MSENSQRASDAEITNSLIVKSNSLLNAQFGFSFIEYKIINLMACQVQAGDEDFKTYYLKVRDLKEHMNTTSNSLNERLELVVERMIQRVIKIRDPEDDRLIQFPLITRAEHSRDGIIGLRFSPELKPHLLNLKERFTRYHYYNIASMNSVFSMRMYEFFKQYEFIGHRTMSIDDLKTRLELKKKYKKYGMFKKNIILRALDDINRLCDIQVDFQEIKEGRKVVAIKFFITRQRAKRMLTLKSESGEKQENIGELLANLGLSDEQINQYLHQKKLDPAYLLTLIEETKRRAALGKIRNPAAYLIKLISTGARPMKPRTHSASRNRGQYTMLQGGDAQSDKIVHGLHEKYLKVRSEQIEARASHFTPEEWEGFHRFVKSIPRNNDVFVDGVVNKKSERYATMIGAYLNSHGMPYEQGFLQWCSAQGHRLVKDVDSNTGYKILDQSN